MPNYFMDYTKDFDSVQHFKMRNSVRGVGITKHFNVTTRPTHRGRSKCRLTTAQQNGSQSKKV